MAPARNTQSRYGSVAIVLHWLMAALLVGLMALGLYMTSLPDAGFSSTKITLILYHKTLGMAALMLAAVRFTWRLVNVLPSLVPSIPEWQQVTARLVHLLFYAVMVALPITGWMMSSASETPIAPGLPFTLPDLVSPDSQLYHRLILIHRALGYTLLILLFMHAGAALRHHVLLKDNTLRKILPTLSRPGTSASHINMPSSLNRHSGE